MKWLILLLLTPLAWGQHGNNHHSDSGGTSISGSGSTSSAVSETTFNNFLYGVPSGNPEVVGGDRNIHIEDGDYPASSAASLRIVYCSGGMSLQTEAGGMSLGGDESSCRKRGIRAITINEMYRQTQLGTQAGLDKAAELDKKVTKLVDDMHDNEDIQNVVDKIWMVLKIVGTVAIFFI